LCCLRIVKPNHTSPTSSAAPIRSDLLSLDGVLAQGEVHVWHTEVTFQENVVNTRFRILDAAEQERASRFLVPAARTQFVLSRSFLRIVLGRYLAIEPVDVRFRTAKHGKPELADSSLQFNLSHTEGITVIALCRDWRVGVDVERIRENLKPLELAQRFFSKKEVDWLRAQPAAERFSAFFACWAAKESYIKALGDGLSMPLADFGIIPLGGNKKLELEIYANPGAARLWSVWQLDLGTGLRSALAVEKEGCTIRIGQWPG